MYVVVDPEIRWTLGKTKKNHIPISISIVRKLQLHRRLIRTLATLRATSPELGRVARLAPLGSTNGMYGTNFAIHL
jgi:hypothetical protein